MTRAEEILKETIAYHNSKNSQFYWFSFNKSETNLFVEMMQQYAKEMVTADRIDAAKKAKVLIDDGDEFHIPRSDDFFHANYENCKITVDRESILNRPLPEL